VHVQYGHKSIFWYIFSLYLDIFVYNSVGAFKPFNKLADRVL